MAVTQYTEPMNPNPSGGNVNIALNSQAITDINANNELVVMLMYHTDFVADETRLNTPTTTGGFINTDGGQMHLSEASGTSNDPLIGVTYTDGTNSTHYADTSGNFDDTFYRCGPTSGDLIDARNLESADGVTSTGINGILGVYKVFSSRYLGRISMRFPTDASKTASSGFISLKFLATATTGWLNTNWHSDPIYICKMSGYGSEITGVDDFSHVEGWESSGSYAAADTILYNATFFGTNF